MAKTPEKKSPSEAGAPYRKRGNPMTDYADAAVPLERGGFSEAPQPEFSGTPFAGSISDWAEQIEKEAEKEDRQVISPLEGEMSPKATEGGVPALSFGAQHG